MATEFKLPPLGEGVESADVSRIHVQVGDVIEAEQNVLELETEKAVADLPCPQAGKITKIHVAEGDTVSIGQTILSIDESGEVDQSEDQAKPSAGDESKADRSKAKKPSGGESEEPEGEKAEGEEPNAQAADEEGEGEGEGEGEETQDEVADEEADGEEAEPEEDESEDSQPAESETEEAAGERADDRRSRSDQSTDKSGKKAKPGSSAEAAGGRAEAKPKKSRAKKTAAPSGAESGTTPGARRTLVEPPAADQADKQSQSGGGGREADEKKPAPAAGPATRRLARELGVDLDQLAAETGQRITSQDVVRAFTARAPAASQPSLPPLPDFASFGAVDREPLNKIGRTAAQRLAASWPAVPQVTQHGLADITELEAARKAFLASGGDAAPKITLTALAIASAVVALKEFPKFNSSLDWDAKEVVLKRYYHIGVAVDTEHGLLIPVIRDADQKSIAQLAAELSDLAQRARDRKLDRESMRGGTFTISNQGGIGGTAFTPLVNYPEVAILGLSRAAMHLELVSGQPQQRLKLPLSLSYDHRVINGADAARFITRLENLLSDGFRLLVQV